MREAQELSSPTTEYFAQPLDDNLFEWHFTVRGPADSDFSGGVYHGRIILPTEYPMKPPNIIVLTPNGRFEVGKKICLSISGHHPESWQPSWSIRTALLAIIGFMPAPGYQGTIGSLDYPPEERRRLARRSNSFVCDRCGDTTRLLAEPREQEETSATSSSAEATRDEAREIIKNMSFKDPDEEEEPAPAEAEESGSVVPDKPGLTPEEQKRRRDRKRASAMAQQRFRERLEAAMGGGGAHIRPKPAVAAAGGGRQEGDGGQAGAVRNASPAEAADAADGVRNRRQQQQQQEQQQRQAAAPAGAVAAADQDGGWAWTDYAIGLIVLAIAILLFRRLNGLGGSSSASDASDGRIGAE